MVATLSRSAAAAVAAILLAVPMAACGDSRDTAVPVPAATTTCPPSASSTGRPRPSATPTSAAPASAAPPSAISPTPSSTRRPSSAADGLAAFLTEAARSDQRLRATAALINGDVGTSGTIRFRPETLAAIRAAWPPDAAARAIPAGLPPQLLRSVLLVYSDLAARAASISMVRHESDRADQLRCLGYGAAPAARFSGDLAVLRAQAAASPAVVIAPADSRAVAEVLLRTAYINGSNAGCGSCGGQVFTDLTPIVWRTRVMTAGQPPVDGTIGTALFRAHYQAGSGWQVTILAC